MADTTFVFKQAIVTFYRKSNKQNTPPEEYEKSWTPGKIYDRIDPDKK